MTGCNVLRTRWRVRGRGLAALGLLAGLIVAITSCGGSQAVKVNFDRRADIPGVRTDKGMELSSPSHTLRIAITGLLNPTETQKGYSSFLTYLAERLGRPVELVQRGTYAELNALMQAGQVDAALVCPFPYIQGHRAFGMELVAATVHRNLTAHYSYLLVPASSEVATLGQLRGRTFAFSDPNSHSGWLAMAYQLAIAGETPNSFFKRYLFTRHHSESVRAVADNIVDGAAVDSLVYDYLASTDPRLVARTKAVAQWGPYPSPPFVVRPDLDPALKARLRQLLATMNQDRQGREVLGKLQLDGFAPIQDSAYDPVRDMEARVRAVGALRR